MRIRSTTIFSGASLRNTEEIETKKTSYWLEKIFNQEKDRVKTQVNPLSQNLKQTTIGKDLPVTIKDRVLKAEKNKQAVDDMISNSNRILLRVSSVFPLDLFPSRIIVEDTRLVIIHRQLFSSQVHSVDIKDVSNIFIDTSIIFAQIRIISNTFAQNQIIVNKLWKKEAILVRNVIEGLRTFINHDIETTNFKTAELINKLKELNATGIII
jgi:hypothetical protein